MQPDRNKIQDKCFKIRLVVSLLLVGFATLTGCTAKYGRIQGSTEVTKLFETQQILPDHTYYFNGFQAIPYVIVGIDNRFSLRSAVWRRLRPTPVLLKQLAARMQGVYSGKPKGAWIIGPDNERIGVWFSTERQTTVRLREDNSVSIAAPQPPDMRGIP